MYKPCREAKETVGVQVAVESRETPEIQAIIVNSSRTADAERQSYFAVDLPAASRQGSEISVQRHLGIKKRPYILQSEKKQESESTHRMPMKTRTYNKHCLSTINHHQIADYAGAGRSNFERSAV